MHLIPHWIPLVASLGLLAGGSFASAAEEAFDLWNECAKAACSTSRTACVPAA